ncbi:50S ribosomal protein L27 [bacterium AB1]|nr:50S ribosomal protein L27 [bacterium AB1]
MAVKKAGKTSKNGRDSRGRRLGLKANNQQLVNAGNIIIRQRGTRYKTHINTYFGKDHTIHAKVYGRVKFFKNNNRTYVSVIAE